MSIKGRQIIERAIVSKLLNAALAANFYIIIENGEEATEPSQAKAAILEAMFQTDDEKLYLQYADMSEPTGWIYLVYGNEGFDVISDYTTNFESLLKPVMEWIDRIEADLSLLGLPQDVWVIMSNDYPAGVLSYEADAETLCKAKNAEGKALQEKNNSPSPRIYWKACKFTLGEEPK